MHIKVLGPIEVTEEGRVIRLTGQRQRALLAALALDLGNIVPVTRLIDVLWGDSPPVTARAKVQAHVSALRQAIGHRGRSADEPLLTCPPGYVLGPQGVELDLAEFEALMTRAWVAAGSGDRAAASGLFAAALALWRGPAFADVASPAIRAAAAVLEERRLLVVEAKAVADLALGRCETVAAQLPDTGPPGTGPPGTGPAGTGPAGGRECEMAGSRRSRLAAHEHPAAT